MEMGKILSDFEAFQEEGGLSMEQIVEKYLKENGYDGLYSDDYIAFGEDGCGCFLGDLFPCNPEWMNVYHCRAGVKHENEDGSEGIGPKGKE